MSPAPDHPRSFSLRLFGPFQLAASSAAGEQEVVLERRKVRFLLAYLALNRQAGWQSREVLAGLFWGESGEEQARASLRNALAILRRCLGEEALLAQRDLLRLNPGLDLRVDALQFQELVKSEPEAAVRLYAGDLLAECYDDWVIPQREALRAAYIQALLELSGAKRGQSEYARALEYARLVLKADPANESAYQHMMFCEMARGNRSAALESYAACAQALQEELGVTPLPETQRLLHWIQQTSLAASDAARITNLPIPPTSFIGRKLELSQIKSALAGARLLTLTGPGGSGKTRLAIQAALDVLNLYPQGVWWLDLTGVILSGQVAQSLGRALGVAEKPNQSLLEAILAFLKPRRLLLVLDNCEHLIEACADLCVAILSGCPQVTLLATSREGLNIPGEVLWRVPTLAVPEARLSPEQYLLSYESVALFVERAGAVQAGFTFSAQNAPAVLQICRRLDGIPLAIELAAARCAALSPEEIAARLDDRFSLLNNGSRSALPRQQTLRALIDWSYDLLNPQERILFARLAVFHGGCTLAAAEAVCAGDGLRRGEILDLVGRLAAKSLLSPQQGGGETRFTFLDTIHQYAAEKLAEAGEEAALRARHLEACLRLAEESAARLEGSAQLETLGRLERESANLEAALHFALESGRAEGALRLANALSEWWDIRGHLSEGLEWLRQALSAGGTAAELNAAARLNAARLALKLGNFALAEGWASACLEEFTRLGMRAGRAGALNVLGSIERLRGSWEAAGAWLEEARAQAEALGDPGLQAQVLNQLGSIAETRGEYARGRELYERSLRLSRETGSPRAIALALTSLGSLEQQQGHYERARQIYDEILASYRALGARWNIAATLSNLGNLAHSQEDYAAAQKAHEEGLAIMREIGDLRGIAVLLTNLGNALLCQEAYPAARRLHEEGLRLRREIGDRRGIALQLSNLADVDAGLGELEEAARLYAEAAQSLAALQDKRTLINCLIGAAEVAGAAGEVERSARLQGGISGLLAGLDGQIDLRERRRFEASQVRARQALAARFEALFAEGQTLPPEELIQSARRIE